MTTTASKPSQAGTTQSSRLIVGAWYLLCAVVVALLALAVYLLFKIDLFSGEGLNDEQFKSLWAFLGVALGAAATIVGTLLTEQNNRRANALAWEVENREQRALDQQKTQNDEAEIRLTLETRTKALELITYEGDYAPKARVGGAVATMMELRGGPVAMRLLADLWGPDKIGTDTAVWLIDRVLSDAEASADEKIQAAALLVNNASKLTPSKQDPSQDWTDWPDALTGRWPIELPDIARNALITVALKVLLSREFKYWEDRSFFPVDTLILALEDPDNSAPAAGTLARLMEFVSIPQEAKDRVHNLASGWNPAQWYKRLLDQIGPWARGEEAAHMPETHAPQSSIATSPEMTEVRVADKAPQDPPTLPSAESR
jgi:hypothetical protein